MSEKVKQFAPQIWQEIQESQRVLLSCHVNPDADSVGSVLAMTKVLEKLSKNVTAIWGDSPAPVYLSSLPGYSKIKQQNWFEINLSDFDLYLSLDVAALSQISKLKEVTFPSSLKVVVIDHHPTNPGFGNINLIDPSYAATCQMLFDLFNEWKIEIDADMALCLFAGIYSDTGGFKYVNVSRQTFLVASELAKTGANFPKLISEMENNLDPKAIEYMGLFFSSIKHYFKGQVAICSISYQQLIDKKIPLSIDIPDLANTIKSAKGNEISISLTGRQEGVARVSMRCRNGKYDLAKIAVATGVGGGHATAAGATIKLPLDQAKEFLLQTIQKVYPELGQP